MKKTLNLKPGDPVTCMRRYYAGNPYHGTIKYIVDGFIRIDFNDGFLQYVMSGGYGGNTPCSLILGHIEPEPLTLPETVEFEPGDRVLAWGFSSAPNHSIKMPGIYIERKKDGHCVKSSSGNLCKYFHVEPFTEAALYAQFPEEAPEQPTQPEQPAPVKPEADETPKQGDWCAFWDEPGYVRFGKYDGLENSGEFSHRVVRGSSWKHARKLKPSDLSPELWAIVKGDKTDTQ